MLYINPESPLLSRVFHADDIQIFMHIRDHDRNGALTESTHGWQWF